MSKSSKNSKASKTTTQDREVRYPELVVGGTVVEMADTRITVAMAKDLLGWEPIPEGAGKDAVALLTDEEGNKVRCTNSTRNRPFREKHARKLAQDVLNRHWKLNGETIVVGQLGSILTGNHSLIGLVLAGQQWAGAQKAHWSKLWPGDEEPYLEKILVFGVPEDHETIRTIDNVMPRDFQDVLWTEDWFARAKGPDRAKLIRMTDYAIRMLWERTGQEDEGQNAFAAQRTHSEAIDFLDRHKHLKQAVHHVWEEDRGGNVSRYLSPGSASAVLYLMGCSASGQEDYRDRNGVGSEKKLDWSRWDQACNFWASIHSSPDLDALRNVPCPVEGDTRPHAGRVFSAKGGGSLAEKLAAIARAWAVYGGESRAVEPADVKLKYDVSWTDDPKIDPKVIASFFLHEGCKADFGGIDWVSAPGKASRTAATPIETTEGETEGEATDDAPTPAELEARKEEEKQRRIADNKAKLLADREAKKNGQDKGPPKPKRTTRSQVESDQTARAAQIDAEMAEARQVADDPLA